MIVRAWHGMAACVTDRVVERRSVYVFVAVSANRIALDDNMRVCTWMDTICKIERTMRLQQRLPRPQMENVFEISSHKHNTRGNRKHEKNPLSSSSLVYCTLISSLPLQSTSSAPSRSPPKPHKEQSQKQARSNNCSHVCIKKRHTIFL